MFSSLLKPYIEFLFSLKEFLSLQISSRLTNNLIKRFCIQSLRPIQEKAILYFVFMQFISVSVSAQKLINTLNVEELLHSGVNPAGEIYVATRSTLSRFDKDGSLLKTVSIPADLPITQFDSWHLTQLVLYYKSIQQIDIYNPALELRTSFTIDSAFAIEPSAIAASFDQKHFWIFDQADGSIKKVNYKNGEVVIDEQINSFSIKSEPIRVMREYQRFLFIQTSKQLYVFNAMGRSIKTIACTPSQVFDFFGEEIFLLDHTILHFTSLFSSETRTKENSKAYDKIYLTDERLFGVIGNSIEIFQFNPN